MSPRTSAPEPGRGAHSLLLTDLYQLNMLQAYFDGGLNDTAVFEFFVRKLPAHRNFLIAAGLEPVLQFLQNASFETTELDWLADSGRFSEAFLETLRGMRFTGEVHALPEGTVFFPNEPVLRVTAPLPLAQLVETRVINLLNVSILAASKAVRMRLAAPEARLIDFGLRRAHGAEAGLLAARAAYVGGFDATATVPAEPLYGVPIAGTMAHSFIEAHESELDAFRAFARSRPQDTVLLIDTYDTACAARKVVRLAGELAREGVRIRGVRLDSGDLAAQAREVRAILDEGGLPDVAVVASGGLDEWKLHDLVASGAPIDGYGVGSALTTSDDAPVMDCAYKLQEYAGTPRRKLSSSKATWPGRKQVWRRFDADGRMAGDTLALAASACPGHPLLTPVMRAGERVEAPDRLDEVRTRCRESVAALPAHLQVLGVADRPYPVEVEGELERLAGELARDLKERARAETGD
jgi:nicotinate phosphoribosyltransferase